MQICTGPLFCHFRLVFEFPATGGVLASFRFRTVKLLQYVTGWDFCTLATGLVFVAFVIYYLVEEILVLATPFLRPSLQ